jgi:hypothetical protein
MHPDGQNDFRVLLFFKKLRDVRFEFFTVLDVRFPYDVRHVRSLALLGRIVIQRMDFKATREEKQDLFTAFGGPSITRTEPPDSSFALPRTTPAAWPSVSHGCRSRAIRLGDEDRGVAALCNSG